METNNFLCRCLHCGKCFNSSEINNNTSQKDEDALNRLYFVSPCCHANFDKVDGFSHIETVIIKEEIKK